MHSDLRRGDHARAYAFEHPLLLWIALGSLITALAHLLFPDALASTAIGQELPGRLETWWNVIFIVGALGVLVGVISQAPAVEALGLIFLAGVFGLDAAALVSVRGWEQSSVTAPMFAFLAAGHLTRALILVSALRRARQALR